MTNNIILGILQEEKKPFDARTPFSPEQCKTLLNNFKNLEIIVQPSNHRCFSNQEYLNCGINISENLNPCSILFGVKEVPPEKLISNKSYMFFSHTIKKQPYNKLLLQTILKKNITLIDYECLKYPNQQRILGFGKFAGIVGAHNGLLDYGKKTKAYNLKPAYLCKDYEEVKNEYHNINLPAIKIVVTGSGRVGQGIVELLLYAGVKEISPEQFLENTFPFPVFTVLKSSHLYRKKLNNEFEHDDFHKNPQNYYCIFKPYTKVAQIMMNGIYWDPNAPIFFTLQEMTDSDFAIKVIADITCDINGSVPCTTTATHIGDSTYGYNPINQQLTKPYLQNTIDVMAIDNLPNELPRSASMFFGEALIENVIPELFKNHSQIIENATITKNKNLTDNYKYLSDFVSN